MSEISAHLHDFVNSRRRDAALAIDSAEQAIAPSKRDNSFALATTIIRGWRPRIESATARQLLMQDLVGLENDLRVVGGQATNAAVIARHYIGQARLAVATMRDDVTGGLLHA
jgi:hypothetical protein